MKKLMFLFGFLAICHLLLLRQTAAHAIKEVIINQAQGHMCSHTTRRIIIAQTTTISLPRVIQTFILDSLVRVQKIIQVVLTTMVEVG